MLFGQVQAFIEVARTGNVSRAAEALYVTQPALAARIQALERERQGNLDGAISSYMQLLAHAPSNVAALNNVAGILYGQGNFREALAFTNKVGELAELQGHHPDIGLAWGRVKVTSWTHKIDGLSESDFVLAAKIDRLK